MHRPREPRDVPEMPFQKRQADLGSARGGRLYATAMATMILEVYYRHLPFYRRLPGHPEPNTNEGAANAHTTSPDRP